MFIKNIIKSKKGALFILCGFPYAGKTHLTKILQQQFPVEVVRIDDIFSAHGFDWTSGNLPDEKAWHNIFVDAAEKTKSFLEKGKNVLYDSTNHTKESRDAIRKIADATNAEVYVIFIKTDESKIWERYNKSKEKGDRQVIPKSLIEDVLNTFETPTSEEHVLIVEN